MSDYQHKIGRFLFRDKPKEPGSWTVIHGDALELLATVPASVARLALTSPPYKNQVDYGVDGQRGLEPTVAAYLGYQKQIAADLARISKPDGNLSWVVRDTFNGTGSTGSDHRNSEGLYDFVVRGHNEAGVPNCTQLLIPERTRIAITDETPWWPILDVIWNKNNALRSANRRPSYGTEDVFLFALDPIGQYWDRPAVLQEYADSSHSQSKKPGAYLRDVWPIPSGRQPRIMVNGKLIKAVASFPPLLAAICVNIGSARGDIVIDPYCGMGTALLEAVRWGRHAVGIDLKQDFCEATRIRLREAGFGATEAPNLDALLKTALMDRR